ncbi:copine-9-like [Dysidea avara]|uniref:copine-9-like n=1 Tax=Dysidea avara TaxID=196820 RepID=UPI00332180BB
MSRKYTDKSLLKVCACAGGTKIMASSALENYRQLTKVELSLSCSKLLDLDTFSKSDPFVVLYKASQESQKKKGWIKLGRTEVIFDNLDPKFAKTFVLDYHFEEVQTFRVAVYDADDQRHLDDLSKQEFIGEAEFKLADVVTAGKVLTKTLASSIQKSCGFVNISGEEVEESKFDITMQMYAKKLDKKDFFGKSDPFVEIAKAQEGGVFTVVYRSQPIMKTLDPNWKEFVIPMQKLCSGDWDRTLKFSVYDWNRSGEHELIGQATCSLRDITMERGGSVTQLDLINQTIKAKKGRKYHNSGILYFHHVRATPTHTFVDYLRGGCEINLVIAVDFTGSNGKPSNPNSLHYNNPYKENDYVSAIKSVATILADYDSDQMFPTFGFGARAPQFGGVSHCFPLNFNFEQPEVRGVQGILDAYHYTVSAVEFYGPTNFSTIMDKTMEYATHPTQNSQHYQILLIITDGVITDMEPTVDRIVKASTLPLSIVIVGVGGADFSAMEILDADDTPLVDRRGVRMARDIVQFVPLREFKTQGVDFSLARETLAEIPGQFLSYMKSKNIKPNPPVTRPPPQLGGQSQAPYPLPPSGTTPYPQPPYPTTGTAGSSPPYPTQQQQPPYPTQQQPPYPTQQQPPYPIPSGGSVPYPSQAPPYPVSGQHQPYPQTTTH